MDQTGKTRWQEEQQSYTEGRKNGWLDASLGICLVVALNSTDGQYASGYRDGQNAYKNGENL